MIVMKFMPYILIATLLYSCKQDFKKDNDKDYRKLGVMKKPKKMRENYYTIENTYGVLKELDRVSPNDYFFNDSGNLLEINSYNENGRMDRREVYEYNINGKCVMHSKLRFDFELNKFKEIDKHLYEFDAGGREKIHENRFAGEFSRAENSYNSSNKIDTVKSYISNGANLGNFSVEVYFYDDNGNITRTVSYTGKSHELKDMAFFGMSKYQYSGDSVIHSSYYSNDTFGFPDLKSITIKDKYSNEIFWASISGQTDMIVTKREYKYEYDRFGSWIKRIRYADGIATDVTRREILYK